MTRSYKKSPVHKERAYLGGKRRSNRLVRRTKDVASGGGYRKVYPRYDIWERRSYISNADYTSECNGVKQGVKNGGPERSGAWYEDDHLWMKYFHRK